MADLSDQIETNAAKAKQVNVDGVVITRRDVKDEIEADRYLATKEAASSAKRGLSIAKLSPPGTA